MFVERKLKPVLKKARESDVTDLVRESSAYLKGLWIRLNGGGTTSTRVGLPRSLPLPSSTAKQVDVLINTLALELEGLEKKLQEASKVRGTWDCFRAKSFSELQGLVAFELEMT